jgi:chromate transporter
MIHTGKVRAGALAEERRVPRAHGISFAEAVRTWARVAALSFGGPAGQIAVMHRILVDEKRWIGEARFLHALNYCMLLPGPEAQQLAIYIGWLLHKTKGGLVAGLLFVLPGIVAIMALSLVYAAYGRVGIVQALFFGLKAAVLAIVLEAVVRIGRRALKNRVMVGIAAAAFVAIFFLGVPFPLIVLAAALIGYLGGRVGHPAFLAGGGGHGPAAGKAVADAATALGEELPAHARPPLAWSLKMAAVGLLLWLGPVVLLLLTLGGSNVFSEIAVFFSKMAVVTFGGAYAVLAYVAQEAVETYGWLRPGEMLDGLGMAETTPGPLIMVVQFVGFMGAFRDPGTLPPLLAGALGGLLTTWVTFVPCFLWIFLGAPFVETLRGNKGLSAALSTITAAVVGVVLNLAVWFALHVLFAEVRAVPVLGLTLDVPTLASVNPASLALTLAALLAVFRFKVGMIPVLAACSIVGVLLYLVTGVTA